MTMVQIHLPEVHSVQLGAKVFVAQQVYKGRDPSSLCDIHMNGGPNWSSFISNRRSPRSLKRSTTSEHCLTLSEERETKVEHCVLQCSS